MARARTVAASNFDRNMRVANQGDDVHSFPWVGARLGARRLVVSGFCSGLADSEYNLGSLKKEMNPSIVIVIVIGVAHCWRSAPAFRQ